MRIGCVLVGCVLLAFSCAVAAQRAVSFPSYDKIGELQGDLYGGGTRGVVLAHGGRFDKGSWLKQAQVLANAGFVVLAIRFRGDSANPDGSPSSEGSDQDNGKDVLAGVAYLRSQGAKNIAVVGASLGGDAAGFAARLSPGGIDRIVFLGSSGGDASEKIGGRKLFIVARDDRNSAGPRLPKITAGYAKTPEPKRLLVVEGSAHAQFLFATGEGPRVLDEIVRFLSMP
jgi:pimeloyl-ACP methyl ester carboxylesterase